MKYTKQILLKAVQESRSFREVISKIGARWSGGTHQNIVKRIKGYGIDTSHFLGQAIRRGQKSEIILDVLVHNPQLLQRVKAARLRKALIKQGRKYECEICNNTGFWLGKKLTLEVDHIDDDWANNKEENLRFLCPNCHTIKNV